MECIFHTLLDGNGINKTESAVFTFWMLHFERIPLSQNSHVNDFNPRNKCLTAKLLKQRLK